MQRAIYPQIRARATGVASSGVAQSSLGITWLAFDKVFAPYQPRLGIFPILL
jgi:hypothetical protein